MIITFSSKKLEKSCSDIKAATKEFGQQHAKKVMQRLNELRAFETLAEVPTFPPMRCHQLDGKRKNQYGITTIHPFRIIITPDHSPIPTKEDCGIDKAKVTCIKIVEVENYHD